ncbi:1-Phosphofructokinase [Melioribacter roseus P3M-2]|uniref:1-Phosphofructokinase n=1 Tax=Melioribacter roseus (strain DSM 23840 / JCM 17771 / VKM B-2668 / P3M-2) TaxID=1191523 RepID=I6ZP17_MELRP|nr:PfkB family carbohydrate kinase [Melioribacter roseus]AFN73774.1 1-Phosphofructokinase [Melioribacter roseus P3M-2]
MILTVTLNPLLERRKFFDEVELGKSHRCKNEIYAAGGKGINVSRQLNKFGIQNTAFTFLGGNNGKILRSVLTNEKINFTVQSTKSETRAAELIIEENHKRVTTFFGLNNDVTYEEAEEFKSKLDKMIQNCSIVVFSGSAPSDSANSIFPYGIELAHKYDKISILDTYGSHLEDCLNAAPTAVHNNREELEKSLGISLKSEKEIRAYMNDLYSKGIKLIFITDGDKPFYAAKFDFHYKITPPEVDVYDATGSGDSFVAAIAYGLEKSMVFDEFIRIATAAGSANASKLETSAVTVEEYSGLLELVRIEQIGKKMKIIDDTPKY